MNEIKFKNEADFHDNRITSDKRESLGFFYESVGDVFLFPLQYLIRKNECILEVGCFDGRQAGALKSNRFESYIGIDISPKAIDFCQSIFSDKRIKFIVENAETFSQIPDESISYAFGTGVLHHLNLENFSLALLRVLKKGGVARFVEPAQGPLILRIFRKLTPSLRTKDEYPFDEKSIAMLQKYFEVEVCRCAYSRPWIPILFGNSRIATYVSCWIDKKCAAFKFLDNQAWLLKIELRKRL